MGRKKSEMQFSSLQVAWLLAFVETADSKKRTAAAATLGVSPSDVTKHIDKLGSWYGGGPCRMLVLPNTQPVELTDDGKEFLPKARELLALLRAAQPVPFVTEVPTKKVSTAQLRVPPPVVSVPEGDGTISEADRDCPVLIAASTVGEGKP